jgi:hypothetical protein
MQALLAEDAGRWHSSWYQEAKNHRTYSLDGSQGQRY